MAVWTIMFGVFLAFTPAKKEEQYMEEEFGQDYIHYRSRTGMFLPFRKKLI